MAETVDWDQDFFSRINLEGTTHGSEDTTNVGLRPFFTHSTHLSETNHMERTFSGNTGQTKFLNVNEKVAVTKPATLELVDEIHNQSALTDLSEDMTTLIT